MCFKRIGEAHEPVYRSDKLYSSSVLYDSEGQVWRHSPELSINSARLKEPPPQGNSVEAYIWLALRTPLRQSKTWCDSGLTVKYCEHLEEYETFPLHFLHQKASIEYTSHVRERPSLCLQFE
jgi:hypothetical protein